MASRYLQPVLRHIRRLTGVQAGGEWTDAQLLERFSTQRDEAAFATLLERYSSLVWGVCRRVLNDSHRAEDAFQATFLVLLRRAGAIGRRERLAGWLYGVACRVALRARAQAARCQARERELSEEPTVDTLQTSAGSDLRAVLDEEVHRLPSKYREPVVLCYLQGKTNAEAAVQLGWPEGTVFGRLARARDCLRKRLVRRGVALSAGALATALVQPAEAAVPTGVLNATLRMALSTATVGAAATGAVSPPVAALAEGVLKAMWMTKLKSSAALVALTLLLAGSGLLAHQALADKPPVVAQAPEGPKDPGTAPASEKTPRAAKLDLTLDSFPKLHTLIRPQDDEWRHLQVEWLTDIVAARKKAAAEDKPIIALHTGGAGYNDPLGAC